MITNNKVRHLLNSSAPHKSVSEESTQSQSWPFAKRISQGIIIPRNSTLGSEFPWHIIAIPFTIDRTKR